MMRLNRSLRRLKRLASPDRSYKRALWLELSTTIDHEYRPEGKRLHWKLATIPVAALVVIFMAGTGVYAFESPKVSEGHLLYPMKQKIEGIHHAVFVHSSSDEQAFQTWLTSRRMNEIRIKAGHLPMELRKQILDLKASIEAQDLPPEEKQRLLREEVQALLNQNAVGTGATTSQP